MLAYIQPVLRFSWSFETGIRSVIKMRAKSGLMTITHICNFKASILGLFAGRRTRRNTRLGRSTVFQSIENTFWNQNFSRKILDYWCTFHLRWIYTSLHEHHWDCTWIHSSVRLTIYMRIVHSSARLRMYMGIQLIGFWCQIGSWGPEPTKHIAQWGHRGHTQKRKHTKNIFTRFFKVIPVENSW